MPAPCYPSDLQHFNFTEEERHAIYRYASETYIDHGHSFPDTIHKVATDLGLKPQWVARAFAEKGPLRRVANDVYARMAHRRNIVQAAKDYVRSIDTPAYKRFARVIYNAPFSIAVFGHGTVGMQTHAGAHLFQPSQWNSYFRNVVRQFQYMRPAVHEAAMQALIRDPHYVEAKRSGLAIDPERSYTDYEVYGKLFGKSAIKPIRAVLEMGNRGFDVLKTYRLEQWKNEMNRVPASMKADPADATEVGKAIAQMVNHSTGVSDIGHGTLSTAASKLLFAAKLEASRWARIVGDPIKTTDTFLNWKQASAGDRAVAIRRVRNAAEFAAFYYATLLANNGLMAAFGSNNRVNFTDPSKSDWLRHKIGDHTIAAEGNLLAPVRFLARLAHDLWGSRTKFQESTHESRFDSAIGHAGNYVRGKLAPFPSIAADIGTQADYAGRPLPFSTDKPKSKDQPKYQWSEYALAHGPIPLSGAIREMYDAFREKGMSAMQTTTILRALAIAGGESLGTKLGKASESYPQRNLKKAMHDRKTEGIREYLLGR
jgi:hypothetical protein